MKVHVDIAINTIHGNACGIVSGEVECLAIPKVGDRIPFIAGDHPAETLPLKADKLRLTVAHVLDNPFLNSQKVQLVLSDLIVNDESEAATVFHYFENNFTMTCDRFN